MRARTAALLLPPVLVASAVTVTSAVTPPAARVTAARVTAARVTATHATVLPLGSAPYRLGYVQDIDRGANREAVWSVDPAGRAAVQATNTGQGQPFDDTDPAYSPDGTKLVYAENAEPINNDEPTTYLAIANADGSSQRQLTEPSTTNRDSHPTWSPDGKMIAFERSAADVSLYVLRVADGTVFGPLTTDAWQNINSPAWSPTDPGTIAAIASPVQFDATTEVSPPTLVKLAVAVTAAGVTLDAVTALDDVTGIACPIPPRSTVFHFGRERAVDSDPTFSPDGGTIAFTGYNHQALCLVGADGTGGRAIEVTNLAVTPGTTDTVASPAFSPDGTLLALQVNAFTGNFTTPSVFAITLPAAPGTQATGENWVPNATEPAFDPITGPVSLTVTATPTPGYVLGDPILVAYALTNKTNRALQGASLVATLPSQLPLTAASPGGCAPAACALGNVPPGGSATATFTMTATVPVSALATGTITYTDVTGAPATVAGQAPVVVLQPTITLDPLVGPPGIVTVATGAAFPPKARVTFAWLPGITAPTTVVVRADGTFKAQVLVLPHDTLGPRNLVAHRVSGTRFGDVRTTVAFLVVPGGPEPPKFFGRG